MLPFFLSSILHLVFFFVGLHHRNGLKGTQDTRYYLRNGMAYAPQNNNIANFSFWSCLILQSALVAMTGMPVLLPCPPRNCTFPDHIYKPSDNV
ncbi:hypothetical protein F5Y16DRAFT_387976 [Xylariaceae sp. FL0255]|nr:hypothetical protein F5Y16DRAFT_387976 [Xylariaceae sp. FL0255]